MNILADSAIPWLDKLFAHHGEIACYSGREIDRSQLDAVDILLTRSTLKISNDLLKDTSVKFVGSATVGCDHVDVSGLNELGIKFGYAPGCNANAVSEYVVSAVAWHDKKGIINLKDNLTTAVIGCGQIGSKVKQKLEILGFDVVVNDPPLELSNSQDWNFVNLEKALKADVICMHTPLIRTGEHPTFHLLDERELELINPNAILINAGRGEVINNAALFELLANSSKLNIVLDVWENEPNIDPGLLNKVNLGTPHIAGHSWRGKGMGTVMIYQQACDFFGWQAQEIHEKNFEVPVSNLELTNNLSIYDVVAQCYDIESDTRVLRDCVIKNKDFEVGKVFDELRKNYYKRPEFSDLCCPGSSALNQKIIKSLGFNLTKV